MRKTMRRIFHDTRIHRNQYAHVFSLTSEDETSMYDGSLFRQQRRSVKTSKKKKRSARREVVAQEEMKEKVIYTSRYIFMHRIYATISKIQLGGILCLGGLNVYTIYGDPNVDSTLASFANECVPIIALTGWAGAIFAMTKYLNSRHVEYLKYCEEKKSVTFALSNMSPSPTLVSVDAKNVLFSSSIENQETLKNGVDVFVTGDTTNKNNMTFSLQGESVAKMFDTKTLKIVQKLK